jgi:hypothetical protein
MADLDIGSLFSSLTRSSETAQEANRQVFTPEVIKEITETDLARYRLLEHKIMLLIARVNEHSSVDLANMILALRNTSLTYLPKV